ncbi:hypothetical protein [Arthrobacter sp. B1805]|nr:hypothetical protein [Arthrobacter sp. B1805]
MSALSVGSAHGTKRAVRARSVISAKDVDLAPAILLGWYSAFHQESA